MSNKTELQNNNIDLNAILTRINELPEVSSGSSCTEIVTGTIPVSLRAGNEPDTAFVQVDLSVIPNLDDMIMVMIVIYPYSDDTSIVYDLFGLVYRPNTSQNWSCYTGNYFKSGAMSPIYNTNILKYWGVLASDANKVSTLYYIGIKG